jgi:hypothetical protein
MNEICRRHIAFQYSVHLGWRLTPGIRQYYPSGGLRLPTLFGPQTLHRICQCSLDHLDTHNKYRYQ